MLKFIYNKKIYGKELSTRLDKFSFYININNNQPLAIGKHFYKVNRSKLEILINIIIYLNFMELLLNLIVKLTYEGFYLRGIYTNNTSDMHYDESAVSLCNFMCSINLIPNKVIIVTYKFSGDSLKNSKYSYKFYFFRRVGR